jgi:hypothetical protein
MNRTLHKGLHTNGTVKNVEENKKIIIIMGTSQNWILVLTALTTMGICNVRGSSAFFRV